MSKEKWGRCYVSNCTEEGTYCEKHAQEFAQSSYEEGLGEGKANTVRKTAEALEAKSSPDIQDAVHCEQGFPLIHVLHPTSTEQLESALWALIGGRPDAEPTGKEIAAEGGENWADKYDTSCQKERAVQEKHRKEQDGG